MLDLLLNSPPIKTVYNLAQDFSVDAFLVGGAVRELHINSSLDTDLDFLVTGNAKPIAQQFAEAYKGSSFCLDKKRSCYRAITSRDGHLVTADFASLTEEDLNHNLMSRDFTINSIGLRLADIFEERKLTFLDPAHGLEPGELWVDGTTPQCRYRKFHRRSPGLASHPGQAWELVRLLSLYRCY